MSNNKVVILDGRFQPYTALNPLPTTQQLKNDTVIDDTSFDLNASAYSNTVTPTYDYIIDNVSLLFTTAESRTITITSDNGTKIYEATNTNLSVAVSSINFGQTNGQSFTVAVTQTAGACSVDVSVVIKNSPVALTADPVTAPGSRTTLQDTNNSDVTASNPLPTIFPDSARNDAFQRLRVSDPATIFDSKQLFDKAPLFWNDAEVSGSNTTSVHSSDTASTVMGVALNTAGNRTRQTYMRFNYQPGKSQLILMTGTLGAVGGGTGITRAMGLFDDDNGVFMMDDEGVLTAVIRSSYTGSPVDNKVVQADWNMDKLDGTGASGLTLDPTKSQITVTDLEWLGVGRVRIGFVINGQIIYVHHFNHANNNAGVYMSTPNLPLRYEITNDGTGAASELEHICSSVMSEGGIQENGVLRHVDSSQLTSLSSANTYAVLGLRLKSTHLGVTVNIQNISLLATTKDDKAHWFTTFSPAYNGSVTWVDLGDSGLQYAQATTANTITANGLETDGGYFTTNIPATTTIPNAKRLGAAIDNTPEEFWLCVKPVTNSMGVEGSMTWRELS